MSTRVKCTGRDFVGITNAYTGEPVSTDMLVGKDGTCLFGAPDTFSTDPWFPTKEAAYAAWNRSEGIEGARSGEVIKCAYTGAALVLEHSELGYRYAGGFDPRIFRPRHEYLNGITMRGGKLTRPEYKSNKHVTPANANLGAGVGHHEITPDDVHMKIAEGAMKNANLDLPKKTRVFMGGRPGGKRK